MTLYQAWQDPSDNSITLLPAASVERMRQQGLLTPEAHLLYELEAATGEEANAIHSLRMGWEPYRPIGEPAPCPRCGATYYPWGSGQCWRCASR
jgi:hypothetical protein